MARQLIIVNRDDVGLYLALCADWAGDQDVAVMLDRRHGERRCESVAAAVERRSADRRQHPPLEAYLAWRGGGAPARKSDVLSALSHASSSIAVRQRPNAKAERRAVLRPPSGEVRDDSADSSMMSAPANAVVALVIVVGTLSGGIVGGLALWLFLTYEFASRGRRPGSMPSHPDAFTWWRRPVQKLLRSSRAWRPAEKSSRA